ncbi:DDE-type integrase/transposase/recombinase [Pelagibius litoralis]|uniref:DDE-type integrase/transposase/recombinase n=1 Tax=Pelagibius litoralis TaxID=374515 RepID=UPI0034611868
MLDFLMQPQRCAKSARRLLRNLLKKQDFAPKRITTDKLKSYAVAIRKAAPCRWYRQSVDVLGD